MTPAEIAAYIGAAAWLPQIITWIYRSLLKAKLRIVPDQIAEVGFTSFGPIFNVRMAFFVEHRDLIVDGIELILRHEDGDTRTLRWAGLGETFSEITDSTGKKQIVSRDQSPIAIKVVTQSLLEKFVRFQESKYHTTDKALTLSLVTHFNFLKQKDPQSFVPAVLESKEYFNVVDSRQKWFWWKPGQYQVTLKLASPQKFELKGSTFAFTLQAVDVELLRRNIPLIDTDVRNIISSNVSDAKLQPFTWQWANVTLLRPENA